MSPSVFKQPQASHSTSMPQLVPQASGPPTDPPQNLHGPSGGRFSKDTIADMKAVALDITRTITSVATEVADHIPVPGLKIALLGLAAVIERIQAMQENVEGVATLKQRVRSLIEGLRELHAQSGSHPLPNGMKVRIEALIGSWKAIEERAGRIKSRGRVMRFLRSKRDATKLGELIGEINDSIQDKIVLQGILNIERYIEDIFKAMETIRVHLAVAFMPNYAKKADYKSNEEVRRSCLEGTRVDFLQQVYTWVTAACEQSNTTPDGGVVLWINGLGGTGKTTVARSVSEWCEKHNLLGGSFFCSKSDAECSDPNLIFLTLCRQLCAHHQPFKTKVEAVLERNPSIVNSGPYRQFEELIVEPLEALDSPFPRSVFVLDALDECKNEGAKSTILSVIAKFIARIAKFLLFIITSRPEDYITALFKASRKDSLKDTTKPLLMHDIPLKSALKDIRLYLYHEFEDHIGVLSIGPDWPSAEEKDALVAQSQGLFIYVATALKFIMDKAYGNPKKRLRLLLDTQLNPMVPHEFLFSLYSTIMVASREKASPELLGTIRNVLGTVVLAQEPLCPSAVSSLLGIDEDDVKNALTRFHSVLYIPANSRQPIRVIHPTFVEFLLQSPNESSPESSDPVPVTALLELQPEEQHWHLFVRSIELMFDALRRDMIGIRYPAMFQSEVEKLEEKVVEAIEPHVSYACRFWSDHLRDGINGATTSGILVTFPNFVRKKLLFWVEACILLDALDKGILALETARNVCQSLAHLFGDLAPLLADCHRFVVTYSPCIHTAPLQIYHCTLSIAPTNSAVRTTYAHERKQALIVEHGSLGGWAPCLDVVPGHGGKPVLAVAISQDGAYFVTGGGDNKATVWKTATRTPIVSFDGHTGEVLCVAYAPNGLHVASGSYEGRVYVWQASSGECVHILQEPTDVVASVAYSGDGRRIVSATDQGKVKLWDATDGRCLLTLGETGNNTLQVGISPDGGVIARGDGASLVLHDVASSSSETLKFPDTVMACVFSPGGHYIAARSKYVIRVWACADKDKSLVRSIYVAAGLKGRLAFSRDGTSIACGSGYGSLSLRTIASEDSPRLLQGHVSEISDVAYSPDKSQAVSVAWDGMIRVWDLASSSILAEQHPALKPPSSSTSSPRFALIRCGKDVTALLNLPALGIGAERLPIGAQMPDGAPTAMLFPDVVSAWDAALWDADHSYISATAREWELLTGKRHSQLSWAPFAISNDNALIAYLSPTSNSVVNVCDLRTGTVVAKLTGHTENVRSIAFSPNKTCLATGSDDGSVKIWDTTTGNLLCEHTDHLDWTCAVTFSPDGRLVASSSGEKTVCIFEIASQRVIRVLDSHNGFVMEVMFAADNTHLMALDNSSLVYIYNVETGARICEFCLQDHGHLRSPIFSPDGSGILVGGGGAPRTVALWNTGTRPWPVYHVTRDGWVYALSPGKTQRLCWLPPEWRELLCSDGGTLCICEAVVKRHKRRRLVVLNMTQLEEYVDTLDTQQ